MSPCHRGPVIILVPVFALLLGYLVALIVTMILTLAVTAVTV